MKTLHLGRGFIRLYILSAAWAFLGAGIPALGRASWTWVGILFVVYAIVMLILGLHPRTTRDLDQPPWLVATYPMVVLLILLATAFFGWLTGAIHSTLWLVYFVSLLVLYGVTVAVFVRSIRRPPPTSAQQQTSSRPTAH